MNEHTELHIALAAATAANCTPCFEHYFAKASELGVTAEEIEKTVAIATKVRGGAGMVMKDSIRKILNAENKRDETACSANPGCCG